jgi:hypothetical protein
MSGVVWAHFRHRHPQLWARDVSCLEASPVVISWWWLVVTVLVAGDWSTW